MRQFLRMHVRPTARTDVICVVCGMFGADAVFRLVDGGETDFGLHGGCDMKAHFRARGGNNGDG